MKKVVQWSINAVVIIMMVVSVVLLYVSDRVSYNDWRDILGLVVKILCIRIQYNGVTPDYYYNSIWESDNPQIIYEVYEEGSDCEGVLTVDDEIYEFYFV